MALPIAAAMVYGMWWFETRDSRAKAKKAPKQFVEVAGSGKPGERPVYPYSVVPGGVYDMKEVEKAVSQDPIVKKHYGDRGVEVKKLEPVELTKPRKGYVSYRVGDRVYWTKKKVDLKPGEVVLTDGQNKIRGRCGNMISDKPQSPVLHLEPSEKQMENPTPGAAPAPTGAAVVAPAITGAPEFAGLQAEGDNFWPEGKTNAAVSQTGSSGAGSSFVGGGGGVATAAGGGGASGGGGGGGGAGGGSGGFGGGGGLAVVASSNGQGGSGSSGSGSGSGQSSTIGQENTFTNSTLRSTAGELTSSGGGLVRQTVNQEFQTRVTDLSSIGSGEGRLTTISGITGGSGGGDSGAGGGSLTTGLGNAGQPRISTLTAGSTSGSGNGSSSGSGSGSGAGSGSGTGAGTSTSTTGGGETRIGQRRENHRPESVEEGEGAPNGTTPVPEPAAYLLVGAGLLAIGFRRRRVNPS